MCVCLSSAGASVQDAALAVEPLGQLWLQPPPARLLPLPCAGLRPPLDDDAPVHGPPHGPGPVPCGLLPQLCPLFR